MKKIFERDIEYSEIFKYPELKEIFEFYRENKQIFKYQYDQLSIYDYKAKPSALFLFIGAFLRVNEDDITDLTEIYVFIELIKSPISTSYYLFYNSLLNFHNNFKFISNNTKKYLTPNLYLEIPVFFTSIVNDFKSNESEILKTY